MIIDKIENSNLYTNLSKGIEKAFSYIKNTDFSRISDGKYEIESENLFALVQEYQTKDLMEGKLEWHHKYIDVQYIISGVEMIGIATKKQHKIIEQDTEKDYFFFEDNSTLIEFEAGMFAVFFPDDLHKPSLSGREKTKVKKVVIKIKI